MARTRLRLRQTIPLTDHQRTPSRPCQFQSVCSSHLRTLGVSVWWACWRLFFGIVDGRYLAVLGLPIFLSFYRSRSLAGLKRGTQWLICGAIVCLSVASLWAAGKHWNKSRDNSPLISAIADAVRKSVSEKVSTYQAIYLPAPAVKPSVHPVQGQNPIVLESGKPILEVLPDSINGRYHGYSLGQPPIPLAKSGNSSFSITVKNVGQRAAQGTAVTGRLRFPDPRGFPGPRGPFDLRAEIKDECEQHPSQDMGKLGPSVGPTETKPLSSAASNDFPDLEKQLLAGDGTVRGFLILCVTYHDDLIDRPLHTAFVYDVAFGANTPEERQLVKDFRERDPKGLMGPSDYLTKVYFNPSDISPYYY
jgi:hypothetical protein